MLERSRGTSTVFNGKVYYGGGRSYMYLENSKDEYSVYWYDPSQNKWTTLPPLPVKWFGLGQVSGKLVAVGGKEEQNKISSSYREGVHI